MHGFVKFHVVVAIHAHHVFHHIAGALHIHAVCGHKQLKSLIALGCDFNFQTLEDTLDCILSELLANECVGIRIFECNREAWEILCLDIHNVAANLATGKLLYHEGSSLEVIYGLIGVDTALKAERSIGVEAEAACRFANPRGVEISRLQEDVGGRFGNARIKASEHTAYAHRLLGVANHEVAPGEGALHAIEGDKLSALGYGLHHNLLAFHLGKVEAVQRLSETEQNEVGDIHDVVDRALAYSCEAVFEPLRAFLHLHVADSDTRVAWTRLSVLHSHLHGTVGTVALVGSHVGAMCSHIQVAVGIEPCGKVACHAIVRSGIDAVGSEIHLQHIVVGHVVVFAGRRTGLHIERQLNDSGVRSAHANLVLGANHTERLHAAYFRLLDCKFLVAIIELSAHGGNYHVLSGSHIGCATHNLSGYAVAEVNGGDVQVVAVGVLHAGEHFAHHQSGKTALDGFNFLYRAGFETERSEGSSQLIGSKVEIDIFLQPII